MTRNDTPITHQGDLAKLPKALAPLIARKQWCVWRWTQKPDGSWQKPPFMAHQPDRHANTNDPNTWTDYATALATVQAGQADGISYMLTKDNPLGSIDLDPLPLHCYKFNRRMGAELSASGGKHLSRDNPEREGGAYLGLC